MASGLRVVVISTLSPVDRFVIREIAQQHPVLAVIRPVWERPPGSRSKLANALREPISLPLRWVSQRIIAERAKRRWREVAKLLSEEQTRFSIPHHSIPTWALNESRGVELLRSFEPDLLLVSSGPLLKPPLLSIPRIGALNLHYGMAPWYRGEHTLYVPWRRGDAEHVGVTLHEIDSGVDTGRILGRTALALQSADSEATLWAKAAREFAEMVPEALQAIAAKRRIEGQKQEAIKGENIRYRDRRWWWELRDALRGAPRLSTTRKREWYFEPA